jgi:hypothetical protein
MTDTLPFPYLNYYNIDTVPELKEQIATTLELLNDPICMGAMHLLHKKDHFTDCLKIMQQSNYIENILNPDAFTLPTYRITFNVSRLTKRKMWELTDWLLMNEKTVRQVFIYSSQTPNHTMKTMSCAVLDGGLLLLLTPTIETKDNAINHNHLLPHMSAMRLAYYILGCKVPMVLDLANMPFDEYIKTT